MVAHLEDRAAVGVAEVSAAAAALRAVLRDFDPSLVTGDAARVAVEDLTVCEHAVTAARLAAMVRVADCGAFPRGGAVRDAADWAAKVGGCSRDHAADELRLGVRLDELDATRSALAEGEISPRKAAEVASTAIKVAGSEGELLDLAKRADLASLRSEARARRLAAITPSELVAQQRKARYHRTRVNELGMNCGSYALMPEEGIPFHSGLDEDTDRRVRAEKVACNQAAKDGELRERQTRAQHAADAFADRIRGGGGPGPGVRKPRRRPEIVLVGDVRTLLSRRDDVGDGCWIQGSGPMPVERFRDQLMAGDAFIKAVVHNGADVVAVEHLGRKLPAELRTALSINPARLWEQPVCSSDGCGRTFGLELDHVKPVTARGRSSYRNYDWKCWLHHDEKTKADRAAGLLGPGSGWDDDLDGEERGPP